MQPSSTPTLVEALRILAREIQPHDGVASDAILEASQRLDEQHRAIGETIEDNLGLADGEDCTLIKLKRAYFP